MTHRERVAAVIRSMMASQSMGADGLAYQLSRGTVKVSARRIRKWLHGDQGVPGPDIDRLLEVFSGADFYRELAAVWSLDDAAYKRGERWARQGKARGAALPRLTAAKQQSFLAGYRSVSKGERG